MLSNLATQVLSIGMTVEQGHNVSVAASADIVRRTSICGRLKSIWWISSVCSSGQ